MLKEVVIATRNKGKLREFTSMLNMKDIKAYSLEQFNDVPDIIENGSTFEENAIKKAEIVSEFLGLPAIADDSGLMVDALEGKPGIYSARFAGPERDDQKNNEKLLQMLIEIPLEKRNANFVSAIALAIPNKETIVVRGECFGVIDNQPKGTNGFGYDPLFYLPNYGKTMAEISSELKNSISHRAAALKKLEEHISTFNSDK